MLNKLRGSLLLFIAALIWGTAFVAQSKGMDYIEPFTYNSIRTILGGFVLFPLIFLNKSRKSTGTPNDNTYNKISFIGGICCGIILFAASSLQQYGISFTTAGKAGFITALYVVIVPVIGLLQKKGSGLKIWICVFLSVLGFYLLCIKNDLRLSKGDLFILICAFFYSIHIILIDNFNSKGADPVKMSCVQFFTAGIIMMIGMFTFETPHLSNIFAAKYTILYTGIMSCGVAYTLQTIGQKYTAPTAATLIMSLESVFAALSGWILLNEKMTIKEIIGSAIVFAAVVLSQIEFNFNKNKILQNDNT